MRPARRGARRRPGRGPPGRVQAIANQLGITERTALDRYLPDDVVAALADTLGAAGAACRDAVATTEPVTLNVPT